MSTYTLADLIKTLPWHATDVRVPVTELRALLSERDALQTLADEAIADAGYWKAEARKAQTERNALDAQNLALLRELRETLRDIETWDGTPDAHAVILENLRAAITTAEGLS